MVEFPSNSKTWSKNLCKTSAEAETLLWWIRGVTFLSVKKSHMALFRCTWIRRVMSSRFTDFFFLEGTGPRSNGWEYTDSTFPTSYPRPNMLSACHNALMQNSFPLFVRSSRDQKYLDTLTGVTNENGTQMSSVNSVVRGHER